MLLWPMCIGMFTLWTKTLYSKSKQMPATISQYIFHCCFVCIDYTLWSDQSFIPTLNDFQCYVLSLSLSVCARWRHRKKKHTHTRKKRKVARVPWHMVTMIKFTWKKKIQSSNVSECVSKCWSKYQTSMHEIKNNKSQLQSHCTEDGTAKFF